MEDRPSPFPSLPEPGSAQQPASESLDTGEPPIVLLVEDNETDIFVIREILSRSGTHFHLRVARDGQEALSFLQETIDNDRPSCPALVILDLNVPKVGGIEVLRRLRSGARCNRAPVVVVTSSDSQSDRDAVRNLGAETYFRKPTDLVAYMELAQVIAKILPPPRQEGA